jgi:hypothetical protein
MKNGYLELLETCYHVLSTAVDVGMPSPQHMSTNISICIHSNLITLAPRIPTLSMTLTVHIENL